MSETITIYLAAGAPFAVSYFLHARANTRRPRLWLKTFAAGLLWPLAALRLLLARPAFKVEPETDSRGREEKINESKRRLLAALHAVSELAACAHASACENLERAACVLRDGAERYVGLAHAAEAAEMDAEPSERELALFRLAGRTGDDLLLAGRCAHRRNVARLREHSSRARNDFLHALAEIGEAAAGLVEQAANDESANRLALAVLKLDGHAVELFSMLEDAEAAMLAAQLLNRECARLRRSQPREAQDALEPQTGEELCTAHTSRPSLAPLSNRTTLAQG
ncbi:MAG: hypothetical protein JOZ52_14160 [Acidobacteria bacterium]|nr:hypothetical protein [Acidobacteriota bacterium]